MVGIITLLLICGAVLVLLAMLIAAGVLIARAGGRDGVSSARQDWIQRRSDDDERQW